MTKLSLSSVFCLLSAPLAPLASRLATLRRGRSPRPTVAPLASCLATLRRGRSPRPTVAPLASCLATCLLLVPCLRAEEWGFAYSGELLEIVDSQRQTATVGGSTSYVTNFYVRLYDDSDGTTADKADALWARLVTGVHVKDGNFSFEIKDSCGTVLPARCTKLQDAFASLTGDRLTVGVTPFDDGYDEISPRQQLVTVPYAASAGDARGLRGDVRLGGGLTVCNASVVSAAFERGVSHQGPVTFTMTPSLPSLTLGNDRLFVAESVETTNEFQTTTLETDFVVAREATVTVKYVGSIVATNLTVRGVVHAAALVAPAVTNALTIHGDVKTSEIEAARIVMDGSVRLFEFLPDTVTIDYDNGDPGALWEWSKNGVTGSWTLPSGSEYTHNHLVSLSLKLPKDGSADITVNGQAVATLKVKGVSGDTWVPFQTLLRPGETLSWVCSWSFGTGDVRLVARAAKF